MADDEKTTPSSSDKKEVKKETLPKVDPTKVKQLNEGVDPNAKKHQIVSFIKSIVRIFGYGALLISLEVGAILLILSEILGITEELV